MTVCFAHVLSNMMQLPPTPPLSQKCTVKQVSTMHTWTCMKPQHQLPLLDTSLLLTHDSTTQLHNSRVSKQTRGQSHTILFLKFSLKDRNIIYDEFFHNILDAGCCEFRQHQADYEIAIGKLFISPLLAATQGSASCQDTWFQISIDGVQWHVFPGSCRQCRLVYVLLGVTLSSLCIDSCFCDGVVWGTAWLLKKRTIV